MADDWYYTQNDERRGPVSFSRLKTMAADGWLGPDELVWSSKMCGECANRSFWNGGHAGAAQERETLA